MADSPQLGQTRARPLGGKSGLWGKSNWSKPAFSGIELCGKSLPQVEHVNIHWLIPPPSSWAAASFRIRWNSIELGWQQFVVCAGRKQSIHSALRTPVD